MYVVPVPLLLAQAQVGVIAGACAAACRMECIILRPHTPGGGTWTCAATQPFVFLNLRGERRHGCTGSAAAQASGDRDRHPGYTGRLRQPESSWGRSMARAGIWWTGSCTCIPARQPPQLIFGLPLSRARGEDVELRGQHAGVVRVHGQEIGIHRRHTDGPEGRPARASWCSSAWLNPWLASAWK